MLSTLLADPSVHLISIIGRGGIGKTWLASKVLAGLERDQWVHTDEPLPVDGILYLSARRSNINFERIYLGCAEMIGGAGEKRLKTLWTMMRHTTSEKLDALLELFNHGVYVILLDNLEDLQNTDGSVQDADLHMLLVV